MRVHTPLACTHTSAYTAPSSWLSRRRLPERLEIALPRGPKVQVQG